jgi:hypothetical protein
MKVEKKNRILLYSWLLAGTHHENFAIRKNKLKFGEFGPFFFP